MTSLAGWSTAGFNEPTLDNSPSSTYPQSRKTAPSSYRRSSRAGGLQRGPSTQASTRGDDMKEYVVALLQGRGNGVEVGIAVHSLKTGHTVITQVADTPFYHKTLQHLTLHPPCTILVPDVQNPTDTPTSGTKLIEEVEDYFELDCELLPRDYWNSVAGTECIIELGLPNEMKASTLMAVADKYYALCATSALFKYLDARQGVTYPKEMLQIRYATSEGTMFIDTETAKNLELVTNALTYRTAGTLYSVLNKTCTPMGARLLRGNILQPSKIRDTIQSRLDAVAELLVSHEKLRSIRNRLEALKHTDLDRLINQATRKKSAAPDVKETEFRISTLLQLEKYVYATKSLQSEVALSRCKMLMEIHKELSDESLSKIQDKIQGKVKIHARSADGIECLSTEMDSSNGKLRGGTTARLFAVRANYNQLLDVARKTYKENLDDIEQLERDFSDQHSLNCRLEPMENKFRLSLLSRDLEGRVLPGECINVQRKKNKVSFSTHELLKRNAKLEQAQEEVLLLSGDIVAKLLASVVEDISGLYHCSDAIAKLDVLAGFADLASKGDCVRPDFSDTIAIKAGRHPILDKDLGAGDCVPNDVYAAEGHASFQLIQGPNMSGKSTFLRQVGLLTIQAMLGCYIPAQYATFRLHDALLSRLSNDDSLDRNLSTFASEMATSAMILGLATSDSMVIIDELGRGTAPLEGLGLSHAIAESLIRRKAFVFFTTHFHDLATTLGSLPGVVRMHLRVQDNKVEDENNAFSTTFQYKVDEGPAVIDHYGLELAKLASLPETVLSRAQEVAMSLSDLEERGRDSTATHAVIKRRKLLFELRDKLRHLLHHSKTDNDVLAQALRTLQQESLEELQRTFEGCR